MALQVAQAVFTGAEDSINVTWDNEFTGNYAIFDSVSTTDGSVGVGVCITAKSTTGVTLTPTVRFSGQVDLTAFDTP